MATYKKIRVKIPELKKGNIVQLGELSAKYQVVEINTGTQIKLKNIITGKAHNQFNDVKIYRVDEKVEEDIRDTVSKSKNLNEYPYGSK